MARQRYLSSRVFLCADDAMSDDFMIIYHVKGEMRSPWSLGNGAEWHFKHAMLDQIDTDDNG